MADKTLYLLDGMALVYRGHFAMIRNPRMTSKGLNTSTLFVFANTLLDILGNTQPSHLAVVFDTPEPTFRDEDIQRIQGTTGKNARRHKWRAALHRPNV